ncbi:MAG TPA: response regulator [Ignavibacteriaceae bacterium]|nr:response regulator [Ignavibacteriaceae bacterium]
MTKKTKILIIDDIPENIYLLQEMLDTSEFEIITASNGKEGIRSAVNDQPDLIICDIMMPELNGYDVMKIVRNNPHTESIPFVFLSAKNSKEEIRVGMQTGADDYLTKPVSSKDLIATVKTRLAKKGVIDKKFEGLIHSISYSLPHELQTPLTTILGFAEILVSDYKTISSKDVLEIAKNIDSSAKRLNELIQKFLLITKLDLISKDSEKINSLQSGSVCQAEKILINVAKERAKYYNREKNLTLSAQPSKVIFSENNLKIVLKEIIDNAFKYSEKSSQVQIVGVSLNNEYVVSILDLGIGMTEKQIATVGEFMQFERKRTEQQGAGLGLSISKKIIELYGGKLFIESIPHKQTIVRITLNKYHLPA